MTALPIGSTNMRSYLLISTLLWKNRKPRCHPYNEEEGRAGEEMSISIPEPGPEISCKTGGCTFCRGSARSSNSRCVTP